MIVLNAGVPRSDAVLINASLAGGPAPCQPSAMMRWTVPLLALVAAFDARAEDYVPGEKLSLLHCGRCHVVNERNRYGGIGSTPSFAALRTLADWEDRFRAFYALNPHPAFTQVAGITPPFVPERPSPIHPVELTPEEIETIIEFTRMIDPKDLGAEIR